MIVQKKVALTFDGSPNPPGTLNILATLEKEKVPGTFFMEGHRIEKDVKTARQVKDGGHEIGNHSYSHPLFDEIALQEVKEEVLKTHRLLKEKVGVETRYMRPPAGKLTRRVENLLLEMGFAIVLWNCTGLRDWEGPSAEEVAERALRLIPRDPLILVFHDRVPWVPEVLSIIVPELREKGYQFEYISGLGQKGIIR